MRTAEMRLEFKSKITAELMQAQVDSDIQGCAVNTVEFTEQNMHRGTMHKQGVNEYHVTFKIPVTEQAYFAVKFLRTKSNEWLI